MRGDCDELALIDLDRHEAAPEDIETEGAKFSQRVLHAGKEIRMVVDEKARTIAATGFLVANSAKYYIAGGSGVFHRDERREKHGYATFHIESAASPNESILDEPRKGWDRPSLFAGGYDIDMSI